MTDGRKDKMISTEVLVKQLIAGLESDTYSIRVGDSKTIYSLSRLAPKLAFNLVNPKKTYQSLR